MGYEFVGEGGEIVKAASKRLEELRLSLPDSTKGMFEFCMMLYLVEQALPNFTKWVRSPAFMEHFILWCSLGCPDFTPDVPAEMLEVFKKRTWVN